MEIKQYVFTYAEVLLLEHLTDQAINDLGFNNKESALGHLKGIQEALQQFKENKGMEK